MPPKESENLAFSNGPPRRILKNFDLCEFALLGCNADYLPDSRLGHLLLDYCMQTESHDSKSQGICKEREPTQSE